MSDSSGNCRELGPGLAETRVALDLLRQGDESRAAVLLQNACRILVSRGPKAGAELYEEDRSRAETEPLLFLLVRLAELYQARGDLAAAAPVLDVAMERSSSIAEPSAALEGWLERLECLLVDQERWIEAEEIVWRLLSQPGQALYVECFGERLASLARIQDGLGLAGIAEALLRGRLALARRVLGSDAEPTLKELNALAMFFVETGQVSRADGVFEQIRSFAEQQESPGQVTHRALVDTAYWLGLRGSSQAAYSLSRLLGARCSRQFQSSLYPERLDSLRLQSELALAAGVLDEAQRFAQELLDASSTPGVPTSWLAGALAQRAWVCLRLWQAVEAERYLIAALELESRRLGTCHPRTTWLLESLAAVAAADRRMDESFERWQRAVDLDARWIGGLSRGCLRRDAAMIERKCLSKLDRGLTLAWRYGSKDPRFCALARRLSQVYVPQQMDVQQVDPNLAKREAQPEIAFQLRHLSLLHAQIHHSFLIGTTLRQAPALREQLDSWRRDATRLVRSLRLQGYDPPRPPSRSTPDDVEFFSFSPQDLGAPFDAGGRPGRQRLLAFVERRQGVVLVDLGRLRDTASD